MRHRSATASYFQVIVTIVSLLSLLALPNASIVTAGGLSANSGGSTAAVAVEMSDELPFCDDDCSLPERNVTAPVEDSKSEIKLSMEEPPVDNDDALLKSRKHSALWHATTLGAPQWRPDEVHRPPIA